MQKNIMLIKIFFLLTGIITLHSADTFSQTRDELMTKGIDYVYRMQFDSSGTIFTQIINRDPKDPTGYFLVSMAEWWKIYINKADEGHDEAYRTAVDKCLKVCDERLDENENNDWALFLKGGIIGYRGFLNGLRDNWLAAVDDGREGLSLLKRCLELNPANKDALLGIGLYNYAVDYVTERYPFLKTLLFFFPSGNKQEGFAQLKDCIQNARFARTEATVVLCYIYLSYEKNYYEAEKYADTLYKQYPENPAAERFLANSYTGLGKWNESIVLWNDILANINSTKSGYAGNTYLKRESQYYLGLCYQRIGYLDESLRYYNDALNLSREIDKDNQTPQQVFSALGLGMVNDLKGNHSEAVKFYDMVLDMKDINDSHEYAKKYKEEGYK
jgi:tetratricopeptide (TPR) repeat protein